MWCHEKKVIAPQRGLHNMLGLIPGCLRPRSRVMAVTFYGIDEPTRGVGR
eukprot:SAG11_NODE_36984_length_259_cov_0.612500_1_plen_49_part_01